MVVFSLLAVLVYQINLYTSEIYFTHQAEKEIKNLSHENKALEVDLAKASSLGRIENYVHNFEKIDKIEYVRVLEDTVLAK